MFNTTDINQVKQWLTSAKNIVITAHKSPDGDSIGSSLALYHYLKTLGHNPLICHPDAMPDFYKWLPGSDQILSYDMDKDVVTEALDQADLIFSLDYNHPGRIGDMTPLFMASEAKKVMIDHHQEPNNDSFDILFSFPKISSTCELIFEYISANGDENLVNDTIGTPIYCGIMTDTGSFRFPSTTATTHTIIAKLINAGVKNHQVHENVYDTNTLSKLKLNGYALSEKLTILQEFGVAYIALTLDELTQHNNSKGDTEGLVNKALSIEGIKMAVFFKEDTSYIKISFRSKGETYVNQLAKNNFEGGGHMYAAGGKFDGSLDEAIDRLVTILPNYVNS